MRLGDVMELSRVVAWDPQLTPEQAVAGAWRVIKEALDADPHTNASLSMAPARASSAAGRMGATSSSSSSAAAAAFVAADDRRQLAAQANDLMRQAVRNGLWDLYYELLGAVRSRGLLVEPDVWLDVLAGAARQDRLDWVRSTLAEIKSLSAATDNKTKSAPSSAAAKMARGIPEGVLLEVLNAAVRGADVELAQHVFGLMHVPAGSAAAAAPRTPSRASYLAYATLLARQRKWEDVLELMSSLADAHGLKSPARTARAAGGKDDGTEASAAAAASKEGSDDDDNEDVEGPASMVSENTVFCKAAC